MSEFFGHAGISVNGGPFGANTGTIDLDRLNRDLDLLGQGYGYYDKIDTYSTLASAAINGDTWGFVRESISMAAGDYAGAAAGTLGGRALGAGFGSIFGGVVGTVVGFGVGWSLDKLAEAINKGTYVGPQPDEVSPNRNRDSWVGREIQDQEARLA
jgi:hypothetical protein